MPFVTITNCSRGNFTLSHPFGSLKLGASKTANITDKQLHSMSAQLQNLEKSGFISIFIGSEKPKVVVTVEIPKVAVSVVEAVVEPVVEAVVEPVVEAVVEPVVEAVAEPVVEAVAEPVVEAVAEPVVEAVVEPVVEAVVEPVVEAVVEPVVEAVAEPVVTNESVVSPKFVLGPDLKIIEVQSDSKTRKRR
jgi:hypothetical protein